MKMNKLWTVGSIILASLLCSCEDNIRMTTILNKDGSAQREICFQTDSSTMRGETVEREHITGVLGNDSWVKEWAKEEKKEGGDSVLVCRASRHFDNVESMSEAFPLEINGHGILKECRLEKRFRWFTTDYVFTETYECFADKFGVPLSKFFDDNALGYWLSGSPDIFQGYSGCELSSYLNEMNKSFERWIGANVMYGAFDLMLDSKDSLAASGVALFAENSREELVSKRDSLVDFVVKNDFSYGENGVGEVMSKYFNDDCFNRIWEDGSVLDRKMDERYTRLYSDIATLNVDYRLAMPGTIVIDCGNGKVEDDVVSYRLTGMRLLMKDYAISATFRSVNVWAYVLTGVIMLFAIATVNGKCGIMTNILSRFRGFYREFCTFAVDKLKQVLYRICIG